MKKKAFTWLEILIIVVVLGMLAAVVVPSITHASDEQVKVKLNSPTGMREVYFHTTDTVAITNRTDNATLDPDHKRLAEGIYRVRVSVMADNLVPSDDVVLFEDVEGKLPSIGLTPGALTIESFYSTFTTKSTKNSGGPF